MARMSAREFEEWWLVYTKLDPFGETRADLRSGLAFAPLMNLLRARWCRDPEPVWPSDYLVDWLKPPTAPVPKQSVDEMRGILKAIADAAAAREVKFGRRPAPPPPRPAKPPKKPKG